MPPVFGPVSSSPIRLKSWAGMQGHHPRAVAEHQERTLVSLEPLLDHDGSPGVAEGGPRELGHDVLAGLVEGVGHPHALPGGQPVRLDHPGPRQGIEELEGLAGLEVVEGRA